jgi:AraC-like DNA-binding protein
MPGSPPDNQAVIASLENILIFELCDPTIISYPAGVVSCRPPIASVGPRTTYGGTASLSGHVLSFGIFLRPFTPWQLFGIPTSQTVGLDCDGTAVFGSWVADLWHQLGSCRTFTQRVVVATETLLGFVNTARPLTSIMCTVQRLCSCDESSRVAKVAHDSAMSVRSYERQFAEEIGISPKEFARLSRFATAIDLKRMNKGSWLNISHRLGYFDQMHMMRDFRIFAGDAPGRLVRPDSDFQPWSVGNALRSSETWKWTGKRDVETSQL